MFCAFRTCLPLLLLANITTVFLLPSSCADEADFSRGDKMVAQYFATRTAQLSDRCLSEYQTLEQWIADKDRLRQQLFEMLGLDPLPEKTDLRPVITGVTEHEQFVVEKVQFQSSPGLYVTGNLYRPREQNGPLPAVLYVCGHGRVKQDGISFGNKVHYHHHGSWFARNGYVCLTIDTLQLGEIEGIHHGTYRHGRWWWNARGYTPAGVEAWNCIRALDYLQSRDEVDGDRLGVTGRSGGGAYSWWIAALDERIQAAVPVAGITSLDNLVVDGVIEGHCDCMFMVNAYGWDFAQVAALVAPRPLLISNTDKDSIFPLDGVVDVYNKVRRIYELHDAVGNIGLQITEGPHKDTQELRIHAFRWLNRHLKNDETLIETAATRFFEPTQLKVFEQLPADERNSTIDETFVAQAPSPQAGTVEIAANTANAYRRLLRDKCFHGWPEEPESTDAVRLVASESQADVVLSHYLFSPEPDIELDLWVMQHSQLADQDRQLVVLNVQDDSEWKQTETLFQAFRTDGDLPEWQQVSRMLHQHPWAMAWMCPRGQGPTAWNQTERKQTHIRRRFALLGQTLDAMRVWDTRLAVRALTTVPGFTETPVWLQASGVQAGIALYAALFEGPRVERLDLYDVPASHQAGPVFLNILRHTDLSTTVPMTALESKVVIYGEASTWQLSAQIAAENDLSSQLQIRAVPAE